MLYVFVCAIDTFLFEAGKKMTPMLRTGYDQPKPHQINPAIQSKRGSYVLMLPVSF
jgi:hypothetical protein